MCGFGLFPTPSGPYRQACSLGVLCPTATFSPMDNNLGFKRKKATKLVGRLLSIDVHAVKAPPRTILALALTLDLHLMGIRDRNALGIKGFFHCFKKSKFQIPIVFTGTPQTDREID